MAKMNLAKLRGMLAAPVAPVDPMEPDVDEQAPPRRKKVKRKAFGKPKGGGSGAY